MSLSSTGGAVRVPEARITTIVPTARGWRRLLWLNELRG